MKSNVSSLKVIIPILVLIFLKIYTQKSLNSLIFFKIKIMNGKLKYVLRKKIKLKKFMIVLLLLVFVADVWTTVKPWAPNNFTLPSRVYDDGTFVRFHQEFLWDQAHVDELHSVTGSDGKYQHEFLRDVDKWDAMNYLCQHYAWWTNLPDDGLHPASEESNYWWCDFNNDEEDRRYPSW